MMPRSTTGWDTKITRTKLQLHVVAHCRISFCLRFEPYQGIYLDGSIEKQQLVGWQAAMHKYRVFGRCDWEFVLLILILLVYR